LEAEFLRHSKNEKSLAGANAGEDSAIKAIELDSEEEKKDSQRKEAIGRARLLVAGAQSAQRDLAYLADALRKVLGQASKFQTQIPRRGSRAVASCTGRFATWNV